MEAGYDYLLLRGRWPRRLIGFTALILVSLGVLLMAGGGAYYGFVARARADLANLNASLPPAADASLSEQAVPGVSGGGSALVPPSGISAPAIASQDLRIGDAIDTYAWDSPLAYEPLDYREQVLLQGFTPWSMSQALPVGSQPQATRIIVPELGIDSRVSELSILNLSDSRTYQTPDNAVGHIPESANSGEAGSSWYFGHLESPIVGEGSVFFHLPRIAEQLKNGEEVFVITDNGVHQYLYRLTSTEVVDQDEMSLYDTGQANIHLVTCVPRLDYSHRLIATGELVGVKQN
ncbi:MAG TPA: sortase [Dehalococcoidia bacterium]|nr:sortase [Dehalococcoidia bacterium]